MRDNIIVSTEVKQTITDICRVYPDAVLERDAKTYARPVYYLVESGERVGMYIRQELCDTLYYLFDCNERGTVKLLKERAMYVKAI